MDAIHLTDHEAITAEWSKLRSADPAEAAAIIDKYREHKDDLLALVLHWMMAHGDYTEEYKRVLCKRQLELINDKGLKPTAAESQAEAECVEAKIELARANYCYQYYNKVLKRLESARFDHY